LHGQDGGGREPTAPNTFMYNGEAYVFHKSLSIRQSTEVIPGLAVDDSSAEASPRVVGESILDLESQQKSTACEVSVYNLHMKFDLLGMVASLGLLCR
jgi:hypothetical protein